MDLQMAFSYWSHIWLRYITFRRFSYMPLVFLCQHIQGWKFSLTFSAIVRIVVYIQCSISRWSPLNHSSLYLYIFFQIKSNQYSTNVFFNLHYINDVLYKHFLQQLQMDWIKNTTLKSSVKNIKRFKSYKIYIFLTKD